MTEEQTTRPLKPVNRTAVAAAGLLAVVLVPLLIAGGVGATKAMSAPRPVPTAEASEAPPITNAGAEAPGLDDPASPPDRGSDQPVSAPQEDTVYFIQDGDTLTAISAELGVSVDAIAAYNAVRDVNVISEGSVLRVPFIYVPPTEAVVPVG